MDDLNTNIIPERVSIIRAMRFSSRDYDRFGIELLKKNGFKVQVFDISNVINPKADNDYMPPDVMRSDDVIGFSSKRELLKELAKLSTSDLVINDAGYRPATLDVLKVLSRTGSKQAVLFANVIPGNTVNNWGQFCKKCRKVAMKKPADTLDEIFVRMPFRLFGLKPARLMVAGGEKSVHHNYPMDEFSEILWAHTMDYDIYLKERETGGASAVLPGRTSTAVFIDEFLAFHPEFTERGRKSPVTPERYHKALNIFFDKVEKELKLEVVIAVHPIADYERRPDYFNGRKRFKSMTMKLVKDCSLVMTHGSTALNFANLFCKPVIFMSTPEIRDNHALGEIMPRWFGKKSVDIENAENINWEKEMMISVPHYNNYRNAYIKKSGSPDLPLWQIFADRLKKGL